MATVPNFYLPIDNTATATANLVADEPHNLTRNNHVRLILPRFGAFYSETLKVYKVDSSTNTSVLLEKDVDYVATEMLHKVTKLVGKAVCTVILILPPIIGYNFKITYQALGGHDQINHDVLLDALNDLLLETEPLGWDSIQNKPKEFMPGHHLHDALDLYGMEYVSAALKRIEYAVLTVDDTSHRLLVENINATNEGFANEITDATFDKVDTITRLTMSAEESLKLLSQELYTIGEKFVDLPMKVKSLQEKQSLFKHLYGNGKLANVSNLLCKQKFSADGTLLNVPSVFYGLQLHLDSEDYDYVRREWKNRVTGAVTYRAPLSAAPEYGASYTRPNINAVKFTPGKYLQVLNAGGFIVNKGKTILIVTGQLDGSDRIDFCVLSNATNKLVMNTAESVAARYCAIDNTNVKFVGRTSRFLEKEPFISVVNLANNEKEALCLNNTPYSYYKTPNNVEVYDSSFSSSGNRLTRIGNTSADQSAELFMLLCWDRELSKSEMHAVLTYVRIKYQTDVNYITNPNFSEDYCNIGSELNIGLDFINRDCVFITSEPIAALDTQNVYVDPTLDGFNDIRIYTKLYLFVLSKSLDLCFWSQEVSLDPHARYELKIDIKYGSISPPDIRLKHNGQWHSKTTALDPNMSVKTLTFVFTPTQEINKLELFNLNPSTAGNSFGMDKVSLVRIIYDSEQ